MKILYALLFLSYLAAAPVLHAQPPNLPPGACATEAVRGCQNPQSQLFKWSEGTDTWPDSACNPTFSFGQFCDNNFCEDANSWAQLVCESNGFDVGIWTGRKQAGCGPGGPGGPVENGTGAISMYCDGGVNPCIPFVETQCAPSDQTQVEIFCCDIEGPPPPPAIPTLSEWGMIAAAAVLGIVGFLAVRRRKAAA